MSRTHDHIGSWVIVRKSDGKPMAEIFSRKLVANVNTTKYRAVPIQEYLASLNKKNPPTEEFALTQMEKDELKRFKQFFPFREWRGVKTHTGEFRCFDTKRKAQNFAKKSAPAAIFKA